MDWLHLVAFFLLLPYQVTEGERQHRSPRKRRKAGTEQKEEVNAAPPTRRMANPTLLKFSVLYCNCVLNREAEEGSATLKMRKRRKQHTHK